MANAAAFLLFWDLWLVTRIATCQLLDLVRREKCEVAERGTFI